MQTLLLNQFFHPDTSPTSQLLTDLGRQLAERGSGVRALCGRSSYADPDTTDPPPVEIVRCGSLRFTRGVIGRVYSYGAFFAGALWRALRDAPPDLVITLTTPPGLCLVGSLLARLRGTRHFIWEMDVYPDIAVDLGVLPPRSLVTRALGVLLDRARRRADGIIVLGECMRDRLIAHGIPAAKIHIAENWADGRQITPLPFPPADPITILYSGNLGLAHDVATIGAAIERLANDARFRFVFAGGGAQRAALEDGFRARAASNISFQPYQPRTEMTQTLGACHLGLVTQKSATLGSVVPSKTYGLMAAGRPILYIGPRKSTPARIIQRFACGWHIEPGDVDSLLDLLHALSRNPGLIAEAGARGRAAFVKHYDLPVGVARICQIVGV